MKMIIPETCQFIRLSTLPLTKQGMVDVGECSTITFGDANRTLVTAQRIFVEVDFTYKKDQKVFENIAFHMGIGNNFYIDLEN